jgi:hypothetical protein
MERVFLAKRLVKKTSEKKICLFFSGYPHSIFLIFYSTLCLLLIFFVYNFQKKKQLIFQNVEDPNSPKGQQLHDWQS